MSKPVSTEMRKNLYMTFKAMCEGERKMGRLLLELVAHSDEAAAMKLLMESVDRYRKVVAERRALVNTLLKVPDLGDVYTYNVHDLIRRKIWE